MRNQLSNISSVITVLLLFILSFVNSDIVNAQNSSGEKTGVLILSHGSRDQQWNQSVQDATTSFLEEYEVEFAYGMANPHTMQPAINKLEASGVDKIVVVQLFVSSYSPIIRQNEYLLGFRDKLADKPMMMHGNHMNMDNHEASLEQLQISVPAAITKPLDDHPLVAKILMDRIEELSDNPSEESILIAAHGPVSDEDNKKWIASIESLAAQINNMQADRDKESFRKIIPVSLRDDASKDVYNQAKQTFRDHVEQADEEGEAIVIPLLLSKGGVESRYLTRLEGLNYTWAGETLLPHDNIGLFIQQSVQEALKNDPF